MNAVETVNDFMMQSKDDETRTNTLMFEFLTQMRNVKALRFSLPAFVHVFEKLMPTENGTPRVSMESIETVEIFHETFRRLISTDFERMLRIFPNTKQIDVYPSVSMLLDKSIIEKFAPLIKTITNLEKYTIKDIMNIPALKLDRLEFTDICDSTYVLRFINDHPEVSSCALAIDYSNVEFNRTYEMITDLAVTIDTFGIDYDDDDDFETPPHPEHMYDILRHTPNLLKLQIEFPRSEEHNFGHEEVTLKKLVEVEVNQIEFDCYQCCVTMLRSCVNVSMLTLKNVVQHLSLAQLNAIAENLKKLEYLAIFYEYDEDLGNLFEEWPSMPKLNHLILNKVGIVTERGIKNLKNGSPCLETLKLYSIRGWNMNEVINVTAECFPNIVNLVLRGGRTKHVNNLSQVFANGRGWRLKTIDITPDLDHEDILRLFEQLDFLEMVKCKYGALVVTRRIYYEVKVLNAYMLEEIVQPMKSRKRIHLDGDESSDSETSSSEMSDDDDDTDSDFEADENDIIVL